MNDIKRQLKEMKQQINLLTAQAQPHYYDSRNYQEVNGFVMLLVAVWVFWWLKKEGLL